MDIKGSVIEIVILLKKILGIQKSEVEKNPQEIELSYDTFGNLTEVVITDKVTNKVRTIELQYDADGNLIKVDEYVS